MEPSPKLMRPIIRNNKSNFVVVTYWWGRDRYNRNTQWPCPEDIEDDPTLKVLEEPITYGEMIRRFEKSCIDTNCNYMIIEYPEFATPGYYQSAINFKPQFIALALRACYPRSVLYLDGDILVQKRPTIFELPDVDYMGIGWNIEFRTDKKDKICYDPYILETSGAVFFFGQTPGAFDLLSKWREFLEKQPGKADDAVFRLMFNRTKSMLEYNIIELPQEYLWITVIFFPELLRTKIPENSIFFEHPECMTSEERAAMEEKAPARYPSRYDQFVSHHIACKPRNRIIFREYIFFPNKTAIKDFQPYLRSVAKFEVFKIIPYDRKYGKKGNLVAQKNQEKINRIQATTPPSPDGVVYISSIQSERSHYLANISDLIPTILKYMNKGLSVLYIPKSTRYPSIRKVMTVALSPENPQSLVLRNILKSKASPTGQFREYTLHIDTTYPMFFRGSSRVLKHLLKMSNSLADIGSNFNSSFDFISRIRCTWV